MTSSPRHFRILISLGSNANGAWGDPTATLTQAIRELQQGLGGILTLSKRYVTEPVGGTKQGRFVNMVLAMQARTPPATLLRFFKAMERRAGRSPAVGRRWGPRTLDIDIIDYAGRVNGWLPPRLGRFPEPAPNRIILPHRHAHLRAFVLVPLLDVAPNWWHPALRQPGRRLLHALPKRDIASVLEIEATSCQ